MPARVLGGALATLLRAAGRRPGAIDRRDPREHDPARAPLRTLTNERDESLTSSGNPADIYKFWGGA
jgi:hypothetical protein